MHDEMQISKCCPVKITIKYQGVKCLEFPEFPASFPVSGIIQQKTILFFWRIQMSPRYRMTVSILTFAKPTF